MSITAEDVRRRIAQAEQTPQGPSAEEVRRRLAAAERGLQVGTQSMGAPSEDPRTFVEKAKAGAAAIAEPWARLVEGYSELTGLGGTERGAENMEAITRGQEAIEQEAEQSGGRTAGNILGDVSMMMLPGSAAYRLTRGATAARPFLGRVAPITAEAGTVGGVEAIKTPQEGETRLSQALATAGGTMVGGAGQAAVRSVVAPRMFRRTPLVEEEMAALRGAGIEPDIPISMGQPGRGTEGTGPLSKFARWMHRRPLAAIPPTQGIIQGQQERALGNWREMMLQKAMPKGVAAPPGPQGSLRPMEDSLEAIDNWYSAQYKKVLDPFQFDVMSPNAPLGTAINKVYAKIPGASVKREVGQKLGDLLSVRATGGQISGGDVSALKTALRREAKLTQDGAAKTAYYDLINAIDEGVETVLRTKSPDLAKQYTALRGPYRNFITIDDAAGRARFGEFEPKDLFQAGQRKAKSERINLRRAPLRQEAQRGEAVYDVPSNTESNLFQLGALAGITAGGATNPWTGALTGGAWLTSLGAMAPGGTRYMAGELPYQRALSRLLRKPGMEELSRAARLTGGQYIAE